MAITFSCECWHSTLAARTASDEALTGGLRGADAATFVAQAAMNLALVCTQRLPAFRAAVRKKHLVDMIMSFAGGWWPDAIAGHMVCMYVFCLVGIYGASCFTCDRRASFSCTSVSQTARARCPLFLHHTHAQWARLVQDTVSAAPSHAY